MSLDWRESLHTLLPHFQAKATSSTGMYHLMIEVADGERDKLSGPPWFKPFASSPRIVNEEVVYQRWDCSRMAGLPGVAPGFREPTPAEQIGDSDRVIRDQSGVVRAVAVPMKIRQSFFCGRPSEEVTAFESLANMAAAALLDAGDDLSEHALASELCDLFRKPRGGVRYVFGEVSDPPLQPISRGWCAGVLQYENGVLIDVPISESMPDSAHWMLLLHRLGWKKPKGSPLVAYRAFWNGNTEFTYGSLNTDWSRYPDEIANPLSAISKDSFYSVLGSRESPVDVSLASIFAIQLLTARLSTSRGFTLPETPAIDYSKESWNLLEMPSIKAVDKQELEAIQQPQVGVVVATPVELQSLLRRLKPLKGRRVVFKVFEGRSTYYVGRLGAVSVVVVMSAMGSVGRDASALVTAELLNLWKPRAVVMVGIAFGRDADKQTIGGVLVSERVISYEPQRLGAQESHARGEEHKSGAILLDRFRNVLGWDFRSPSGELCQYQIGPVLSGEKLVDNLEKKTELFSQHPTAIGGEMEGAGFAAAAERKKCAERVNDFETPAERI